MTAVEGEHRADLDERGLAQDAAPAPAGHRPGGVRAVAVRRLRELEPEALGQEQERVEKTAAAG